MGDNVIEGQYLDVAVKEFRIPRSSAAAELPQFMREVYLQKNAQHPCIVQTFGGYWPDIQEAGDYGAIEPWIVMERLTCNLLDVLGKPLLESQETKRRILGDVAEGIAHLHSHSIIHRDIKPENVLMRVIDGKVIGRAKICDFGASRTRTATRGLYTRPIGTTLYMPPE